MSNLATALLIYALGIVVALLLAALSKGILTVADRLTGAGATAPVEPAAAEDAMPSHHLVAIAAAVYAMLGSAQRIVHIEDSRRGRVWTSSTRAAHHASHHLPRHRR